MDLQYDWKGLQKALHLKPFDDKPVKAVDFTRWDALLKKAFADPSFLDNHFIQQWERLQDHAHATSHSTSNPAFRRVHFLQAFFRSGVRHLLPRQFGVLFRWIEPSEGLATRVGASDRRDRECRHFFVLIRGGEMVEFYEPNFAVLASDKQEKPEQLVRHLSEKHALAVQCVEMSNGLWNSFHPQGKKSPWRAIFKSFARKEIHLYPDRPSIKALLFLRGLA